MNGPNSPKNAVANRELTQEFKDKWDMDLATINNLQKSIEKNGGKLVVRGGFATEAFAGGSLTRAHNDIDAHFLNLTNLSDEEVFKIVEGVIKAEETKWQLYKRSPEKIEFREREDKRPFFNRRRIELYVANETNINPEKKKLIFNNGREIEVDVAEFYGFVSGKIRKLFMVNDRPEEAERETNLSDYTDLKRLLNVPGYDKEKTLRALSEHFKKVRNPDAEAKREYEYVMELLTQL